GSALECRGGDGNHTLVFTFNNNVVSGSATVTDGTGSVSGSSTFNGNTMTVNLTGVSDAQTITVTLSDVTDNLSQIMPDTSLQLNLLLGDVTGNRSVSNTDVSSVKTQVSLTVDDSNFRNDITANGGISNTDVSAAKGNVGATLP
ncbi:MAG TPA: hypothetical protein VJ719_13075, partial [Chthoniobacterales bacterium]|nr:hypothetical protein [Chthoniobacterales bacterium]